MQTHKNYHRNLWLLCGTGDGPPLVEVLVKQGWRVSLSVVSQSAGRVYEDLPLENIWIGPINGPNGVKGIIEDARSRNKSFDWVIDATHPFATTIRSNLFFACAELGQPLLRYERPFEKVRNAKFIKTPSELAHKELLGKRFLFAIGTRNLQDAVKCAQKGGAEVFARVFSSNLSLRSALATDLDEQRLAVIRPPRQEEFSGAIELALCRRWSITSVLCRQSGGITEKLWKRVSEEIGLELWLIARPAFLKGIDVVYSSKEILDRIEA